MTSAGAFRAWWSVMLVLVTAVTVSAGGLTYTNYVQRQADHRYRVLLRVQAEREARIRADRDRAAAAARTQGLKIFCAWVRVQIDPALGEPTTERGNKILAANVTFYQQIGCGKPPR